MGMYTMATADTNICTDGVRHTLFPRLPGLRQGDAEAKRAEIRAYFLATCDRYEQLFEVLAGDAAYFKKPIALRHPLIFYLGHTATFFINKLVLAGLVQQRIDPKLESMFAVGVDEMSWDDLNDANYYWPSVAEVMAYRQKVREVVDGLIQTLPLALPIDWNHPWWPILMGIEHERIHIETSSVLIRQHALEYVRPHPAWQPCRESGEAPLNCLVDIPAGQVRLGQDKSAPYYGWDNEFGTHVADIPAFQAGRCLVSNREFLEFVEAGGYANDACWDAEGLAWRKYARAQHPTFWIVGEDGWRLRLMIEVVDMPWDWPVEVNCLEARAFCNWKCAQTGLPVRLPTEDEWYRLYDFAGLSELPHDAPANGHGNKPSLIDETTRHARFPLPNPLPEGEGANESLREFHFSANLHLDHWASSCPVTRFRHGELFDVVGNVWQWTETPIYPFDGFEVHPLYDDFTTPTYDGRHNLFKGGSWISCGNESLKSARYAFRRHFFQHAGFRYVVADAPVNVPDSRYENDKLLSEYAEFHYGDEHFGVPNFPQALAHIALDAMRDRPMRNALDLGCAAGRATFELARQFDQVTGIDFSARFIGSGVQMVEQGTLRYTLTDEGELVSYKECKLADLGLDAVRHKVEFFQGDACNLKPLFSGYDLILAANLIDRLYCPKKFLVTVHERINPGGILLIASPYTWLEAHTKREEWLGGFKKDGENYTTLDGLKDTLGAYFHLLGEPHDVPFVIRETNRKFQHSVSQVTLWERV